MPEGESYLARAHWRERYPWLILLQTFSLAISLPIIACATAAILLVPVGWRLSEVVFIGDVPNRAQLSGEGPVFQDLMDRNARWPFPVDRYVVEGDVPVTRPAAELKYFHSVVLSGAGFPDFVVWTMRRAPGNVATIFWRFVEPFRMLFNPALSVRQTAYLMFGCLWTVAVWAFFGGVITRLAVVRLGREEPLAFKAAIKYAFRKWRSYFAAPWMPLLGILLLALPLALLGLLMRLDVGAVVVGLLWPIMLILCGLLMALLAIGTMFGWPLMWGAISTEQTGDAFEAFSRSFSYTYQRPLHYLFYAFIALLFSELCWLVVEAVSEAVIWLTAWGLTWGAGAQRFMAVQAAVGGPLGVAESLFDFGAAMVRSVATGVMFGLFWCLAAGIYLLLRADADRAELDDVFLEDEHREQPMPELSHDAAGVPGAPADSTAVAPSQVDPEEGPTQ